MRPEKTIYLQDGKEIRCEMVGKPAMKYFVVHPETGRWIVEPRIEKEGWCLEEIINDDSDPFQNRQVVATFEHEKDAITEAVARHSKDVEESRKEEMSPLLYKRLVYLESLGETFWVRYGDGERWERWPDKPKRFAVCQCNDRYQECFWETCGWKDLIPLVTDGGVERIVDLDKKRDIPFKVDIKLH